MNFEDKMSKLSRIQTFALAAALSIAVAVPIALAQTGDAGGQKQHGQWRQREMRGGFEGGAFRNLDLTDAQKAQMKQIRESHSESLRTLGSQIRTKRQELHQASQGGSFNEALVTQKLTEIAPLEAKLMGEQFRIHQEMLSILTPDQKTKLDQAREQFKSRRSERPNKQK
jgi:periplasmic protein CpxP/Spy